MENKRHSPKLLFAILLVAGVVGAGVMYKLGLSARNPSPQAREFNRLLNEKTLACAGHPTGTACKDAIEAIDRFLKGESFGKRPLSKEKINDRE